MRFALAISLLVSLGPAPVSAFGRVDFAARFAQGCFAKTLEDPNGPQALTQLGVTAREFCDCLGEHIAATLTPDELRFLDIHHGDLPASVRDRPTTAFTEVCASLHGGP